MFSNKIKLLLTSFLGLSLLFHTANSQHSVDSLLAILSKTESRAEILNLLAEATIEDSLELSKNYAKQAYRLAIEENNTREKGMAFFWMGEYFAYQFQFDSATSYYEKALVLLKTASDDYNTSYCLNNLGWIYNYFGQRQKAIDHYTESLQYLDREKHLEELPNVYINIGNAYHHMGSYHTAIKYFHQAIPIIDHIEDKRALPIACNGLGLAWKYLGNFDSAIIYYDQMLEIDKKTGTPFDRAIDYGNIGALYYEWGQLEQSKRFHQLSLEIYQKEGDKNSISIAYNNLGEVYYAQEQYDSSLFYLNKALEIDRETGMEHNMALRYNNIGDVYSELEAFDKALEYYQLALEINQKSEATFNIALNLKNIARIYQLTGNIKQAEILFDRSLGMARNLDSKTLIKSILESMTLFFSETGRFARALQYHEQLDGIKDSIFKEKNQQLLADLQTRHDLDQKEKEIAILNSENRRRVDEAQQYRLFTLIFALLLIVVSILLVILLIQYNLRKKAYKKLVQINKELANSKKVFNDAMLLITNGKNESVGLAEGTENGNHKKLFIKIKKSLLKEKPYLKPDLTLKEWAQELNTNTHYLSEVINREFGNSFTGLINEYRVKEACKLLADKEKQNLTIEGIAYEAGFNSKSVFNNAFKSVTGLTPSYYRKSVKIN